MRGDHHQRARHGQRGALHQRLPRRSARCRRRESRSPKPVQVQRPVYVMLNKPAGFLSTRTDPRQRDTVFDLLPADFPRVVPRRAARSGQRGPPAADQRRRTLPPAAHSPALQGSTRNTRSCSTARSTWRWRRKAAWTGRIYPDRPGATNRASRRNGSARRLRRSTSSGAQKLKVILKQGLKRQVRLMFFAGVGYEVKRLQRVRLGPLKLGRVTTSGRMAGIWMTGEVAALKGHRGTYRPVEVAGKLRSC